MLHPRDGYRFPPYVTLGIQANEFNLGFIRPEDLVSHDLRVHWVPFGLIGEVLQIWLSFWKVLPSPQSNSGALSE